MENSKENAKKINLFQIRNIFTRNLKNLYNIEYGKENIGRELKSLKLLLQEYDLELIIFAISKFLEKYSTNSNLLKFTNKSFFDNEFSKYKKVAYFYNNIFRISPDKRKYSLILLEEYEDYITAIVTTVEDKNRKEEIIQELEEIYGKL